MRLTYAVQLLAAASCVTSLEILEEALPDNQFIRDLYLRFRPYLEVDRHSCCTPFPVVDGNGTTAGEPAIDHLGACQKHDGEGQVYARGLNKDDPGNVWGGKYAIMYAWFFPVILENALLYNRAHDWQQIVVWLSGEGDDAAGYHVSHIAYSQPDGYLKVPFPTGNPGRTNAQVLYGKMGRKYGMDGRGLSPTEKSGWPFKMVTWEKFTDKAKEGVSTKKNFYNDNIAPFSDLRFGSHMNASALTA